MSVVGIDLKERGAWVDQALRDQADPQRRQATAGYFPTALEILGVSAREMRQVLGELVRSVKEESPERVLELVRILRDRGTHEGRQVAFELLDRRRDARSLLGPQEVGELGEGNDNWASVDAFCVYVSGPAWREDQIGDGDVLRWAGSPDRWWRRTALVSTVPLNMKSRGGTGAPERTLMICGELAGDRDPMVSKGLSWALRALIGVDREAVEAFLARRDQDLSALVRREVRNKLETGRKNP